MARISSWLHTSAPAPPLAIVAGQPRSATLSLSMRHGSRPTWFRCVDGRQRRSPARLRAAWPLAHHDVPRRAALRPTNRALRIRWADQWRVLRAYVEQLLVPCLRPGDIVIMDNLGSHKSAELRRIIRLQAQGCGICRLLTRLNQRASLRQDQALDARGPERTVDDSGGTSATSSAKSRP